MLTVRALARPLDMRAPLLAFAFAFAFAFASALGSPFSRDLASVTRAIVGWPSIATPPRARLRSSAREPQTVHARSRTVLFGSDRI